MLIRMVAVDKKDDDREWEILVEGRTTGKRERWETETILKLNVKMSIISL